MEAKQVADMMEAYASIYEKSEEQVEVIDEEPVQDYRDMKRAKENAAGMRGPELSHSAPTGGSAKQKPQPRSREFSHGGSSQPRSREFAHKEEVETDLFDVILEYLVAEGFADTNENALAIMANMSEDWRQSIVEDIRGNSTLTPVGKAIGTGVGILKGAMGAIKSGGGYSTRPGDGKPYKDGPLWGPGSSSTPKTPVKKPSSQAPMRDEPLW